MGKKICRVGGSMLSWDPFKGEQLTQSHHQTDGLYDTWRWCMLQNCSCTLQTSGFGWLFLLFLINRQEYYQKQWQPRLYLLLWKNIWEGISYFKSFFFYLHLFFIDLVLLLIGSEILFFMDSTMLIKLLSFCCLQVIRSC